MMESHFNKQLTINTNKMPIQSVTQEVLNKLLSATEAPCISLYMPTHRTHPENKQDLIRYKNLVKQVSESVTEKYPTADIDKLLAPFEALAMDQECWNHASDGLAVLGSSEHFEAIRMQLPVEALAMVADSFHTKPLQRILQSIDRYHVLALTLDAVHFYEGNRYSLHEIDLPDDFPKTMEVALGKELTEKHSTVASYGGVSGHSANMHHGQGGKKEEVDNDAERFFRVVSNAVYERYSNPEEIPLILATLPEHHSLYSQVDKNPFMLPKGIDINPESVSIEKLTELSWEVMKPVYLKKLETLAEKYNQLRSKGLGSDSIDDVLEAAEAGKVETILLEAHRVVADRLRNKVTGTYEMADLTQPVLDDQLDDLGELVQKMGGTVVIMPKDQMPSQTGIAAIFRY
jgi:hypothetical protein